MIYLYPGDLAVAEKPAELHTLLGSCVAVALYDRKTGRTGLNHYLLPGDQGSSGGRYGSSAIPELIARFRRAGSLDKDLVAKIYGGANVLADAGVTNKIGDLNIEIARRLLSDAGIPILEEGVGGFKGRKISVSSNGFTVVQSSMGEGTAA